MVKWVLKWVCLIILVFSAAVDAADSTGQAGGMRGMIYDKDFDVPLANARILINETGQTVDSTTEGNYVFGQVAPGTYTLIFSKQGYTKELKGDVVVSPGQMTEVNVSLSGDFTEMEDFVVQDVQLGGATEEGLLALRVEAPQMMDSISSELMKDAGASDAAGALKLVAGATVQDGKFAVIRGLPDRYVNSQMNGVRLPTADADKRAVQLDQFPSAVIESIQVSKTFTPDQQGDASGGAVNIVLKGIPEETVLDVSSGMTFNTNVIGNDRFLTYKGGGVNFFGMDNRDIPPNNNFDSIVGISRSNAPTDYKWSVSGGGKRLLENDVKIGGFASFFYDRNIDYFEGGIDDKYWVETPGSRMTPQFIQGSPGQGDFKTQLFDVTQGSEEVKWGTLGTVGLETENHAVNLLYMFTQVAEDVATLAEDTRGKRYYFPGYDRDDPSDPGNQERDAAPYIRTETLKYTERATQTVQLSGTHTLGLPELGKPDLFMFTAPELSWGVSKSFATLDEPDKRQFGSIWWADSYNPGFPPWVPPFTSPAVHRPFKPAANFTLGNLQRVWKYIEEDSDQWRMDLKMPFTQWTGDEGYVKMGLFSDQVKREYDQDSFSNFNDNSAQYEGPWSDFWSGIFPSENHPVAPAEIDVDYQGLQDIFAGYYMADIPIWSSFNIIGGIRHEITELSITNEPEKDVTWIPPGASGPVALNPGDADVSFKQTDILPSLGFEYRPTDKITLRGSYSETVARQTFKELTPIMQQEFLGGDVFIGNPALQMSSLQNYDIRLDYKPYDGGLISASYFHKDIENPIEYVQRNAGFTYTTPVNYPKGKIDGIELEIRQDVGHFWERFDGLSVGANATFIESQVTLPPDEAAGFNQPNIRAPLTKRDMTNAPEYLYNIFLSYDITDKTKVGLYYTVRGDTLVAGAGQSNGKFVPSVYETAYGTLNFNLAHSIGENTKIKFQAKNLLDPKIESVYRSKYIPGDVTKTSYRKGIEFSLSLSHRF